MSQQATTTPSRGLRATLIIYVLGPLLLLFIVAGLLFFRNNNPPIDPTKKQGGEGEENQLALARAALGKQADLATCRGAIQQLNAHLNLPANRDKIKQELKQPDDAKEVIKQELKLP